MQPQSKRVRRLIREAAGEAYRRELEAELGKLEADFARWRRGELAPFELSDRIHRFHQGPNRELYVHYTSRDYELVLAGAVMRGVMGREDMHPDAAAYIMDLVEKLKSLGEPAQAEEDTETGEQ